MHDRTSPSSSTSTSPDSALSSRAAVAIREATAAFNALLTALDAGEVRVHQLPPELRAIVRHMAAARIAQQASR